MTIELEAKVQVADFAAVRARLEARAGRRKSYRLERNVYFDTTDQRLLQADHGLRIRSMWPLDDLGAIEASGASHVITFKGPQQGEGLKQREEIELTVPDAQAATDLMNALGYRTQLGFEKRRESWALADCTIELDELPLLGRFVEVEGCSRDAISNALREIGLSGQPTITRSYISMLAEAAQSRSIKEPIIRFNTDPRTA